MGHFLDDVIVWQLCTTCKGFAYRESSLAWTLALQIYCKKRKFYIADPRKVKLPQDWFGAPTWSLIYCVVEYQ